MTSRDHAGRNTALHQGWQTQKTKGIGDLRAGSTDTLGEFLLGAPEVLKQLTIRRSFFQGIQLRPVKILKQRIAKKISVFDIPDDRRDRRQPRVLCRSQASFTHDELKATAVAGLLSNDNGLQDADFANAVDEFSEQILVKDSTGLPRVCINEVDVDLAEFGIRDRLDTVILLIRVR